EEYNDRIRTERARSAYHEKIDVANSRRRVQHNREKRSKKDDEVNLALANTEPQDGQRNPRQRRNRANEFQNGIERPTKSRDSAHCGAEWNSDQRRNADRGEHASQADRDVLHQDTVLEKLGRRRKHGRWRR